VPPGAQAHAEQEGSGLGADFLGWLRPSELMPADLRSNIKGTASRLREKADVMVVVGIGGSYLGPRAVIEAIYGKNYNDVLKTKL